MKKYLLTGLTVVTLSIVGLAGANLISAHGSRGDDFSTRIAERFNLNQDEVSGFMQEMHDERMAGMEEKHKEGLDQAVADGVITSDQRDALLAKHQEMRENHLNHMQQMDQWFEDQGIDHEALMQYLGFPGGPGHHFRGFEK